MPADLRELVKPPQTAILVIQCVEDTIGEGAFLPGLRQAVLESGMLPRLSRLLECARSVGAQIVHCIIERQPTSRGMTSTRLRGRRNVSLSARPAGAGRIVPELAPHPSDIVSVRGYGSTAFYQSGLDNELRSQGVQTVVPTGVSLNIAVTGTTFEAVNLGYKAVIPADCVASDPASYAESLLSYTLRNVAMLTTAEGLAEAWAVEW